MAYEVRAASLSAVQQYGAKVHYKDILIGEYFVDLPINDVPLVELKTVKALDDAHARSCNAPITRKRPVCNYARCLILASRALRSNAWPMAYKPRQIICVFCVHRLPASALTFFLDLQRRKAGNASQDCTRSQRIRASTDTLDRSESL